MRGASGEYEGRAAACQGGLRASEAQTGRYAARQECQILSAAAVGLERERQRASLPLPQKIPNCAPVQAVQDGLHLAQRLAQMLLRHKPQRCHLDKHRPQPRLVHRPQQRLLLEVGYEATHGAALRRTNLLGLDAGVFVGISTSAQLLPPRELDLA